jgi:hypothetical protein
MLKAQAAAIAAATAGISLPAAAQPVPGGAAALQIKWSKAPCRFCGTGCGVMVGVREGQVVATHGDMQAEVNRGLNCVKGYFLSKIMYGEDRLTQPLLRKRNGVYDKEGEFEPVSWDEAFDVMAEQAKRVLREKGPRAVGHVRLGPVDDLGGLCRLQADAGGLPVQQPRPQRAPLHGLGRHRLHPHLRHRRADGLLRRFRACRRLRAVGLEHGGDAPDPVDAAHRPPAQPPPCPGRLAADLHQPQLRPRRHSDRLPARHRSGDPQLHRPPHHLDRAGQPEFVDRTPRSSRAHRYRLRPAAGASAAAARAGAGDPGAMVPSSFEEFAEFVSPTPSTSPRRSPASSPTCWRNWPSSTPTPTAR